MATNYFYVTPSKQHERREKMKKIMGCIVALLLSTGSLFAQDKYVIPEQKIMGAEKPIPLGEVVFLSLSRIDNPPAGYVKNHVSWKVIDGGKEKAFRTMPDGSIFFGSGTTKRKITVFASVSYLYVERRENQVTDADVRGTLLSVVVELGDGSPGPEPDPDPTFPDGKYKLASYSFTTVKNKVAVENRVAAPELAKAFRKMAQEIKDGKWLKIEDILIQTTKYNREALDKTGIDRAKWDGFFTDLQDNIYKLYADKKLVTKEDFVAAWEEIALGLEKV
jgi:hypothetical protein